MALGALHRAMASASFRDKGVRRLGEPGEMALDPGWRVASPRWRSGGFLERHCGRQPADHLPLRSRDEPSMSISSPGRRFDQVADRDPQAGARQAGGRSGRSGRADPARRRSRAIDPFAVFHEWGSEADEDAFADL